MKQRIKTTCPYCGVGCGLTAAREPDGGVSLAGDETHPSNAGRLCSKGAALEDTLGLEGRLLHPMVGGKQVDWDTATAHVADGFARIIRDHGPDAVAFYVSGQLLTEDYYVANKLMKGFIGSGNIDTNSRLCMSSSVAGHKRAFGGDVVPGNYEDIEAADLVVLVGSNAAWCHPVLYQRLIAAADGNPGRKVVVIDPRRTPTADGADLHLAIKPGSDTVLFNGLLADLHARGKIDTNFVERQTTGLDDALQHAMSSVEEVARGCGLDVAEVEKFFAWFANTGKTVTLCSQGVNQSSSGVDKVNAIINCHLLTGRIGRPGMGPFSLTGQPNAMGGREVGGLANQLAAHMEIENTAHRRLVQDFWRAPTIATKPGLKAIDMFAAIGAGKIKAVWIMATNPAVSLPDANRVRDALKKCELVVVSDCMQRTDTTVLADVLLPATTWGEKDGTVTNSERRISRQRAFMNAPGQAKPDWRIICDVATRMGFGDAFAYRGPSDIFREHAALSGAGNDGARAFDISGLAKIDDQAYEDLQPVQWPVNARHPDGTPRLFGDGHFLAADGKARFVAVTPRAPANKTSSDYPLIFNTGRVRDHWHTMTRTGKSPRLSAHTIEPVADIHATDAKAAGVADGGLVRIESRWGRMIARIHISSDQQPGSVFAPMHWSDQFSSHGRAGAVVNPAYDPISGQPELKQTPIRISPHTPRWQAFVLSRREIDTSKSDFRVRATGDGLYRYELAGDDMPKDWDVWAAELLDAGAGKSEWLSFRDAAAGQRRYALLKDGRLQSCLFIARDHRLSSREWLAGLFAEDQLKVVQRTSLLAGRPATGQDDTGSVVCSCFGVGVNVIARTIRTQGLTTAAEIGAVLKAGTNCGSCKPELDRLLQQTTEAA
jgi:assimilatory nitrate reductase catalytic subunit